MNIIAITPFTGDERLVAMTQDCIEKLAHCDWGEGVRLRIVAVNNAASRRLDPALINLQRCEVDELILEKNYGFGVGVNKGIDYALICERWPCDHVLVFNNDLQFPHRNWLAELVKEVEANYVLSPCTDITATFEAMDFGPVDRSVKRHREVSAFCWLVPVKIISRIEHRFGYPLFCPQFTNYGSDDATAAILRTLYGETPFKIVPRSFVKHLKAQTAKQLGVKAGTKELLTDLKKWKTANKLR